MSRQQARAEGRAMGPAAVFGILLAVVAVGASAMLMRSDPPEAQPAPSPQGTASPTDQALTDAEAIARFKELDTLRLGLFEDPKDAVLRHVFVDGSPAARRVGRALHELKTMGLVLHHRRYRTTEIDVIERSPTVIRLRQTVFFSTATGHSENDLPPTGRLRRQVIRWVLRKQDGRWLIYDGAVATARFLK